MYGNFTYLNKYMKKKIRETLFTFISDNILNNFKKYLQWENFSKYFRWKMENWWKNNEKKRNTIRFRVRDFLLPNAVLETPIRYCIKCQGTPLPPTVKNFWTKLQCITKVLVSNNLSEKLLHYLSRLQSQRQRQRKTK